MKAAIKAIEYYLPAETLPTSRLAAEYPEWSVEKIEQKTGIRSRHIAAATECASDLAFEATKTLFDSGACQPREIDYILLCTQSPDYFLPTTACILQNRLGIPTSAGAMDFNLGCSGFVYGLGMAQGLIETGQAGNVLLLTAETYSKHIHPGDKSVRTIFGDAAAATLISGVENDGEPLIGPFVFGTDGAGANNLMVPAGGLRRPRTEQTAVASEDDGGNVRSQDNLYMNGAEIFTFTLETVPKSVNALLQKSGKSTSEIDLFVLHQANKFMLDRLRKRMKIPEEKFCLSLSHCGNTVSSTIPIVLKDYADAGKLKSGDLAMLVGFGVGYSWAASLVRWC